jgi:hypothetical protein
MQKKPAWLKDVSVFVIPFSLGTKIEKKIDHPER